MNHRLFNYVWFAFFIGMATAIFYYEFLKQ